MTLLLLPTLVAILTQFVISPMLFGARKPAEILCWGLLMGIFQGIPSLIIYLAMFAIFGAISPSETFAVLLAVAVPALVVVGYFATTEAVLDFDPLKPMLAMGSLGSLSGTLTYLFLR